MPVSKEQKFAMAERRLKVANLYLQGWAQFRIAQKVEVDPSTITRDLQAIQEEWVAKSVEAIEKRKAEELAKIDQLEYTYWESWERSLEAFKSKIVKGRKTGNGKKAQDIEQTLKEEERAGDPRFLAGVQWCIEKRMKIFGLEAPQKIAPTDPTGEKSYQLMDESELAKRFVAILNGAAAKEPDPDPGE